MEEEKGGEEARDLQNGDREEEWEDIPIMEEDTNRSETAKLDMPNDKAMGRPTNTSPGRPRGRGQRGFWVRKREASKRGRTKSKEGEALVKTNDPKPKVYKGK